ncbi:class I SAM-dependent methyltransferase [aff. Roholtiella sp. LEGE 12411]|uniref:class I SAM-dependent methyltransferase n=1 Tax=aff. Roholtiella sp. LEGE 12411 TaxID=1828822 RepID=UPI0018809C64|nr:class I SAM-dependent methyltransferase [aff. Roholtiella sp. LEGE 12411]MBE9035247.1 class I SAM-dependent methyltransferase [aff. Roholtiella sp. LEGE 12411]
MIEANNYHPKINIDELMQKIHDEVAKRQVNSQPAGLKANADTSKIKLNISYIEALLKNAESRTFIRTKWPDKLDRFPFKFNKLQQVILKAINFFFKDQREVNFNLINSLKESIAINRQLIEQITTLKLQVDERLDTLDRNVQRIDDSLNTINTLVGSLLTSIQERLDAMNIRVQGIDEHLSGGDTHIQEIDEHLSAVDTCIQRLDEHLIATNTRIETIDELYIRNDSYLKNDLMQQKRLITIFLEEARKCLPEPFSQEHLQTFVNEDQHLLDAFYVAFEDQFRGSREDIFNTLKVYLPLIQEAQVGTPESSILDVGCGRGEWLELLRESGYTARGIDINRVMLEQCRYRGLEVVEADVIEYLRTLPDGSLGAVTGFHIIEHLSFETLVQLFDQTVRVLKPGGLVIFETPNTRNILVGSGDFYRDPTHKNPIHPDTISFLAKSRGLIKSEAYFLEEIHGMLNLVSSSEIRFDDLNDYVKVSRNMVLIAYKA